MYVYNITTPLAMLTDLRIPKFYLAVKFIDQTWVLILMYVYRLYIHVYCINMHVLNFNNDS